MGLSLKNKFTLITIVLFLIIVSCRNENKELTKEEKTECKTQKPVVNPNGSSELALLMRKMLHSSDSIKQVIKQGGLPETFPDEFLRIHTAKPTDSETKKASFDGFATYYLNTLKTLYSSPKSEVSKNYNAVIDACLSCHSEHCPGPVKAIGKLKID